jgi:hypothetical protein
MKKTLIPAGEQPFGAGIIDSVPPGIGRLIKPFVRIYINIINEIIYLLLDFLDDGWV